MGELRGDVPKHWWMLNSFDMSSRISSLNHWNPFSANVSLWSCEDELDVPLASNGLEFPWASRCGSPLYATGLLLASDAPVGWRYLWEVACWGGGDAGQTMVSPVITFFFFSLLPMCADDAVSIQQLGRDAHR